MEKYYKISESELLDLLEAALENNMLQTDGVDNWEWYGESRKVIIKEYFPNKDEEELRNYSFKNCAELILKDYEEIV